MAKLSARGPIEKGTGRTAPAWTHPEGHIPRDTCRQHRPGSTESLHWRIIGPRTIDSRRRRLWRELTRHEGCGGDMRSKNGGVVRQGEVDCRGLLEAYLTATLLGRMETHHIIGHMSYPPLRLFDAANPSRHLARESADSGRRSAIRENEGEALHSASGTRTCLLVK